MLGYKHYPLQHEIGTFDHDGISVPIAKITEILIRSAGLHNSILTLDERHIRELAAVVYLEQVDTLQVATAGSAS